MRSSTYLRIDWQDINSTGTKVREGKIYTTAGKLHKVGGTGLTTHLLYNLKKTKKATVYLPLENLTRKLKLHILEIGEKEPQFSAD